MIDTSMKHSAVVLTVVLAVPACGAITDVAAPPPSAELPPAGVDDLSADPGSPPGPPPDLWIEAPTAATTSSSLFALDASDPTDPTALADLIAGPRSFDVVHQVFVTRSAGPLELVVRIAPPRALAAREHASEAVLEATETDHVLCEYQDIATFDERCEDAPPVASIETSSGPVSASRWSVRLVAESGAVPHCAADGPLDLRCELPPGAGARYRIVVAVTGVTELWGRSERVQATQLAGVRFTGAIAGPEYQCWDWATRPSALYCAVRYRFRRAVAMSRAALDIAPIATQILQGGGVVDTSGPPLRWDTGAAPLPTP